VGSNNKHKGYRKQWDPITSITAYFTSLDKFQTSLADRGIATSIKEMTMAAGLVGKSIWNSSEFHNYSDSGPFELWNLHQNFIFLIVKCVPANSEHVSSSLESSPAIDSSNFMNQKMFSGLRHIPASVVHALTALMYSKANRKCDIAVQKNNLHEEVEQQQDRVLGARIDR
jgi:hypothetical protein